MTITRPAAAARGEASGGGREAAAATDTTTTTKEQLLLPFSLFLLPTVLACLGPPRLRPMRALLLWLCTRAPSFLPSLSLSLYAMFSVCVTHALLYIYTVC